MLKKILIPAVLTILAAVSLPVYATSDIKMDIVSEKEVTIDNGGKAVVKRVVASTGKAGEVLIFTIRYQNTSAARKTRVEATYKIPDGLIYVDKSATGANGDVRFSVDGGKTYKKPTELTLEKLIDGKKETVKATPADYTNIEWVIGEIGAGQSGELGYRALLQ